MIGRADHHLGVPRELAANLACREKVIALACKEPAYQAAIMQMCKQDILWYVNLFVWQYNPKKKGGAQVGPFITWPFQERALVNQPPEGRGILWCYENDRPAVVEKSREMGASWLFLIVEDWLCLFHDYTKAINVSLSADAVDCKDPDSLFWKIRFMHEHLPEWLRGDIVEESMYLGYKRTKSYATGYASTGRAGVGGRGGVVFVDEFPEIKEDTVVRAKTASTSDCRFFNGTHKGTGTEFYQLTQSPEFVKIQFHWTQHPDKNQGLYSYDPDEKKLRFWEYDPPSDQIVELKAGPKYEYPLDYNYVLDGKPTGGPHPGIRSPWYDWKVVDIGTSRAAAMELDIDPTGSVEQFFEPILIHMLRNKFCREPLWTGFVEHEEGKLKGLRKDPDGKLRLWINLMDAGNSSDAFIAPVSPYGGGADVSQGTGATPSCLSIADAATGNKVLEYADAEIDPVLFASLTCALGRIFLDRHGMPARIAWEHNGPGISYGDHLVKYGYAGIRTRRSMDRTGRYRTDGIGWVPQGGNVPKLLLSYKKALEGRKFLNMSEPALLECLKFKFNASGGVEHTAFAAKNSPSGARQNHGDLVVADALANLSCEELAMSGEVERQEDEPTTSSYQGRMNMRKAKDDTADVWNDTVASSEY